MSKEAAMEAALHVPKLEIITIKKASDMDIEPEYRGRRNRLTPAALYRHRSVCPFSIIKIAALGVSVAISLLLPASFSY